METVINELTKKILSNDVVKVIRNISKDNQSIKKVGIFGSYARGDYNYDSDFDILYEHTDDNDDLLEDLYSFAFDIESELPKALNKPDIKIDFVTIDGLNSGIMKDLNQPIVQSILNDVIWIYTTNR